MENTIADIGKRVYNSETSKKLLKAGTEFLLEKIKKEKAISLYLDTIIRKYSRSKSLIFNKAPIHLYEFYVDLDVSFRGNVIENLSFRNIESTGRAIVISGNAGSGKTTLLKHLFLDSIKEKSESIPFFIELRKANDYVGKSTFEDFVYQQVQDINLEVSRTSFENILRNEECVFFLDGYDEVNHDKRKWLFNEISKFINKFDQQIIMTSRPNSFIAWNQFSELNMKPLSQEKAIDIIKVLINDIEERALESFIDDVESNLFIKNEFFLSNPLLLTILLITYNQTCEIPSETHLFYKNAYDELYQKHDASKGWFRRKRHSNITKDEFTKVLCALSFLTYCEGKYHFRDDKEVIGFIRDALKIIDLKNASPKGILRDLIESCSMLIQDGQEIQYIHKSFQEYFSSLFIVRSKTDIRSEILETLKMPEDEKLLGFLFELDIDMMESEYSSVMINEISNRIKYKELPFEEAYKEFLKINFYEFLVGMELYSFYNYENAFAEYLDLFYEKYQRMYPDRLKPKRKLIYDMDYSRVSEMNRKLISLYEEKHDVISGYLDMIEDDYLKNTVGRVYHLDITNVINDEKMYKLLIEICKVEFIQLEGVLDINESKIKIVERDTSAKKVLISKYLKKTT